MKYTQRSDQFESFLERMNRTLATEFASPSEEEPQACYPSAQIVGLPRSGTTILYQLLASTRLVGYPSNVMALFWQVPTVGARIQVHLSATNPTLSQTSMAGRTREPLDPHEFGYFWREALGRSRNTLERDQRPRTWRQIQNTLDSVSRIFAAPTVYKNFYALQDAVEMRENLKRNRFILISRDPSEVAASLWTVRRQLGVPDDATFGIDPGVSIQGSLIERIISQVNALDRLCSRQDFRSSPDTLEVDYDALCADPRSVIERSLHHLGVVAGDEALERIPPVLQRSSPMSQIPDEVRYSIRRNIS